MSWEGGEIVICLFVWRIRFYIGRSTRYGRRIRAWRSDLGTRGVFVVPWADRAIGMQWRRTLRERP